MTPVRLDNLLRLERDYDAGRVRVSAGPLEALVEVAARCNLRCPMCPITVDPRYQPGSGRPGLLSEEVFDRLEKLAPTLHRAHLFGLGEPVLNPHLPDYVRRLASRGVEVWITTNATLIDEGRAEALAAAGLERATVSMDAATPATYEFIRRRGRFEDALRGLRALVDAKRRHGRPRVYLSTVAMRANVGELVGLAELGAREGADGVFVEQLYDWPDDALHEFYESQTLERVSPEELRRSLAAAENRARELGIEWSTRLGEHGVEKEPDPLPAAAPVAPPSLPEEVPDLPWACSEPWATINVNASGEVRTCCFNDDVLGSLADSDFDDVWNGPLYRSLRDGQVRRKTPAGCEQCVRNGRVKQSRFFIRGSAPVGQALPVASRGGFDLEHPADGDVVAGTLVLAGRMPPFRRFRGAHDLPDVFLDDLLVTRLELCRTVEKRRFVEVIPIPYVSPGRHRISLRWSVRGREVWHHRHVQVIRAGEGPDPLVASDRAIVPVDLERRTPAPTVAVDGSPSDVERWTCARRADRWLGLLTVPTTAVAPGEHELLLRFRGGSTHRRRLWRVSSPSGA